MPRAYSISELEIAINFWRNRSPSQGDELALCPEASALASLYATLIISQADSFSIEQQNDRVRAALAGATGAIAKGVSAS
jgi:hypothetical protein